MHKKAIDTSGAKTYLYITMSDTFAVRLRKWRGLRMQKTAADILSVPIQTLRKWEYGKRTPKSLTMSELERRMIANPEHRT